MLNQGRDELSYQVVTILRFIDLRKVSLDIIEQKIPAINYGSWFKIKIYQP